MASHAADKKDFRTSMLQDHIEILKDIGRRRVEIRLERVPIKRKLEQEFSSAIKETGSKSKKSVTQTKVKPSSPVCRERKSRTAKIRIDLSENALMGLTKPSSDEDSEPEDISENYDEDYDPEDISDNEYVPKVSDQNRNPKDDKLSDYQKMIKRNKDDRMKFLKSLEIDQLKQDLSSTVKRHKAKPKKKKIIKPVSPQVQRKSRRLPKQKVDLSEDAIIARGLAMQLDPEYSERKTPVLPPEEALVFEEKSVCQGLNKKSSYLTGRKDNKSNCVALSRYENHFKYMEITESRIAKVVMSRITSMAIHPSSTKVLVTAGNIYGEIGLWDVESTSDNDGLYLYEPHSGHVSCQAFNPGNSSQLCSCSHDGTLRCGDLGKMEFDQVYHSTDEDPCNYFDFLSPTTFLVCHRSGAVVLVDARTDKNKMFGKEHQTYTCSLKTVSVHPVKQSYFISAGKNGIVSLWDLRNLKKKPITNIHHDKCVNSAFFSPVTGNSILTTSLDDKISIFDSTNLRAGIKRKIAIEHNNCVAPVLTAFRASWLPNSEKSFVVGSLLTPRRIDVYNVDGDIIHNFTDENFNSVTSVNIFHPCTPVLACGNSGGKVHVFLEPQ